MEQKLETLLNFMMRPAVEYNLPQRNFWGISVGENSILAASGFFMIEIENTGFEQKPEGNFFSYVENKFGEFAYPLTEAQLRERAAAQCKFVGKVMLPVTNIINRLDEIDKHTSLKKCRVVVSPGYLESGELTLKFVQEGGEWLFKHPSLPEPVRIAKTSPIQQDGIRGGVVYRCAITETTETSLKVNVIEPYGKMRLGVLYSPQGFVPTNIEDINRMTGIIPPDMIICTNMVDPDPVPAPPIHLDGSMMFDLLKVFLLCSDTVELHLPDDPNKPVMFTNIPKDEKDLRIRIIVATLNPFFGGQRR